MDIIEWLNKQFQNYSKSCTLNQI